MNTEELKYDACMNIPPYWICEKRCIDGRRCNLRGSSHNSMEEARARMEAHAGRMAEFYRRGDFSQEAIAALRQDLRQCHDPAAAEGEYGVEMYEPIVERVDAENVITRNRYGAEVLNSRSLCMLDIDAFPDPTPIFTKLLAIIGIGAHDAANARENALCAAIDALCRQQKDLGMRLYRSARGWRVILQGEGLGHASPRLLGIARRLHTDALYLSLCQKQGCFRARLTPKPARLRKAKLGRYPQRLVSDTPAAREAEWVAAYRQACEGVAVCRLVESFGRAMDSPVLALHDARTLALRPELRLA